MPARSLALVVATLTCSALETPILADTVVIEATNETHVHLHDAIADALKRLSTSESESHLVTLSGQFQIEKPIRVNWHGETPLTIAKGSSPAILDGAALPEATETLFLSGRHVTVRDIRFVNSRGHALVVGGGTDQYRISGCTFVDCQHSGIHVWNDPYAISEDRSIRGAIVGNKIQRFNLAKAKWANDGITVYDQRVRVAQNVILDSPTETNGIRAMGRDLVIERNRVAGVSRDDSGGIYLWGGPHASMFRGNVVRWNRVNGASRGIYLDDGTSGAKVSENLIEDSAVCGIFVSGGRDNEVFRNVIDRSPVFFHLDSRCLGWDSRPEFAKLVDDSIERLKSALADETVGPLLREWYPGVRDLDLSETTTESYAQPRGNHVHENFVRDVATEWELMDFSQAVTTDFHAMNSLASPALIESSQAFSEMSFHKQFGIEGFDRILDLPVPK